MALPGGAGARTGGLSNPRVVFDGGAVDGSEGDGSVPRSRHIFEALRRDAIVDMRGLLGSGVAGPHELALDENEIGRAHV